jgi:hypothetical protein
VIPNDEAEKWLSDLADKPIELPERAVVNEGPETCPACDSSNVMWGCDPEMTRTREEIHPLVWHETEWMADTFICRDCTAGWIEPDQPETITWVRPYWLV